MPRPIHDVTVRMLDNDSMSCPSSRDALTLPDEVEPPASPGPVLIIHPDQCAAADMARDLKGAGWLAVTAADGPGRTKPAVLILHALDAARAAADVARIRRSTPGTPVLFLTTPGSFDGLLRVGTQAGDDYLTGPFTAADVALRLRWLTRNAGAAPEDPELTVGDLTLRPRPLLARRGDHEIPLTKTQCSLLRLLMENPGVVVSKSEIAKRLWPHNSDRGGNNVELHISYLRQKLNAAGPPMIHTLRGAGYLISTAPVS
jgi:two-component system, OmpR family, response regulator